MHDDARSAIDELIDVQEAKHPAECYSLSAYTGSGESVVSRRCLMANHLAFNIGNLFVEPRGSFMAGGSSVAMRVSTSRGLL